MYSILSGMFVCLGMCVYAGDVMIMLVGTKLDLVNHNPNQREVEQSTAESLSKSNRQIVGFYETSALDNIHVEDVFIDLARALLMKHSEERTVAIHSFQNLAAPVRNGVGDSEIKLHHRRQVKDTEKSCHC